MIFDNNDLRHEFFDEKHMDWSFRIALTLLDLAYFQAFHKDLTITCLGRKSDPSSAHGQDDKLVCASDIRSKTMSIEELQWFDNIQRSRALRPYMDIVIEDERMDDQPHPRGAHIHFEINPKWWFNF